MIRNLIQRKVNAKRIEESSVDDLLGLLLQSSTQNNQPEDATSTKSNSLSIDEVIEECKQFYLAGQETTSSWLTWTMVVLAMHQDWQEKAREEVLLVCGKRNPNFEAITHLKIVSDILNPTTYILTSMRSPMQSHNTINCDGLNSHT